MPTLKPPRIRTTGGLLIAVGLLATGLVACSSSKSSDSSSSASSAGGSSSAGSSAAGSSTAGAAGSQPATGSGGKVNIVAYSVPKPGYDALEAAFQKTPQGSGVTFAASYGPSGTQATAVTNGQKADYVNFSVGSDMTKLVPKFVDSGWDAGATKGIVSDSVVVIAVRPGNPKHITGWDDLVKPGIKIVTPDPASSGSAKWNILAAYSHVIQDGGTDAQAQDYLKKFFANVASKPSSGSLATSTFLNGTGDALISYESEAIGARQKGQKLDYVIPDDSMLIETPGAVTKDASPAAKDFLSYVLSDAGQQIFASKGFRPAVSSVQAGTVQGATDPANPYPAVKKLETISALGGWTAVNKKYFDKENGIVTKIENG
jgi:sulfate transport system substrate-binding protein